MFTSDAIIMSLHDNDRKVQTRDYLLGVNQVVDAASVALGGVSEKKARQGLIRHVVLE